MHLVSAMVFAASLFSICERKGGVEVMVMLWYISQA